MQDQVTTVIGSPQLQCKVEAFNYHKLKKVDTVPTNASCLYLGVEVGTSQVKTFPSTSTLTGSCTDQAEAFIMCHGGMSLSLCTVASPY